MSYFLIQKEGVKTCFIPAVLGSVVVQDGTTGTDYLVGCLPSMLGIMIDDTAEQFEKDEIEQAKVCVENNRAAIINGFEGVKEALLALGIKQETLL
jgi:hypothetical protein